MMHLHLDLHFHLLLQTGFCSTSDAAAAATAQLGQAKKQDLRNEKRTGRQTGSLQTMQLFDAHAKATKRANETQ